MSIKHEKLKVSDMHCTSCEGRIEREIGKLDGIKDVKASYAKGTVEINYDSDLCNISTIKDAIKNAGYGTESSGSDKIAGMLIIGAAILLLGRFSAGFDMSSKLQNNVTYFVLFVVGLLTSLHCVGMCGGIMLSQSISNSDGNKLSAIRPSLLYNMGRVISYTILGGVIGAIGSVFNISLKLKAGIMIFAGIFMIIMGLNMAGFNLFRRLQIKLPWSSCKLKGKVRAPFVVGLLNGLMPCGPLQTMQLYALGTGSAVQGALSMFVFSIGTVPLMLVFGLVTGLLSSGYTKKILKFSGILVVVLGFIMSNRGLTLSGININPMAAVRSQSISSNSANVAKAEIKDDLQTVKMTADGSGYTPNVLFVQKGIPVRWIVDGKQITSCNNQIVVPSLDIQKNLNQGENVIEFTPKDTSDITFSCWMGMINGVIKVVDNLETADTSSVTPPPSSSGGCCGGGAPGANGGAKNYSIYGDDITKVPTNRLVKRSTVLGKYQSVKISGVGYEFEPLIVVINKGMQTNIDLDLYSFDNPDGEFQIIDGESGNIAASFTGKRGNVQIKFTPKKAGIYGIVKDGNVLGIIEAVDNVKTADLEKIRKKYVN